ncbi:VWA domain-containing protein [Xenorhabdus eapokensis]|uniref:VWA domain-containing protein n=1 Tax=Xenorhabdus eapokensis TaxID=1873482 RepID=A0A1Q5TGT4_9GAMM|nr:VWA domain-containing protein [Xenorhabdus eapokensis]OKO99411.1 VWA domain-containing protein [Xenorhabdus eapokensis]
MSKKRTIYSALPIVAAAYGEKLGVKVAIGNDEAYTDGKTIVVPNIPDDYPHMDAVWGYLAHEAAHVRFTDFGVERRRGLHTELSNVLEDCRIERAMMELFPGTSQTLNEVARYMAQAGHYEHVTDKEAPASILTGFCLYWLQTKAVGQSVLQPYLDSATSVFERVFPQGVVVRLNALLRKAVNTKSTAEVTSLADQIIKMIEEEKEKEEQKSQNGQDSNNQQNAGGNSDAAKMLQQVLNAGAGDLRGDAHDALKAELNRVAQDKGDSSYMTVRSAVDTQNNPAVGKSLVGNVKSTTSKIRTQLYGLVQASQRVAHRNQRLGKRVDARKLHRVVMGDTRVFLNPEAKKRPNTAVHILVDMSSSMVYKAANGKERQDIAREASLAISMALEAIPDVNPAVTFFGGNRNQPVFSVVKHGDTVQNRAGRFGFKATGGTPMAEAMWYAAFELTKTREERKMLIVVTDGQPQSAPACRSVIDLCERSDVEVIGIGVETTAVSGLFQKNIVIDDAAALQRTLFRLMERSLTAFAA